MKRRILPALLALCMVLTLLPAAGAASGHPIEPAPGHEDRQPLLWDPSGPEPVPPEGEGADNPGSGTAAGLPDLENWPEPDAGRLPETESGIPEFVPGVVPREYELHYPSDIGFLFEAAPSSYDTRERYQTPAKNQGTNGLCWAFCGYSTLEAQAKKIGLGTLDFSELHMAYSTSDHSGNTSQGFDREPADGGHELYTASYLMRGTDLSGTVDEAADPYDTNRIGDRPLGVTRSKEQSYTAQNIIFLTGYGKAVGDDTGLIKWAVQEYGGVGASMYHKGQTTAVDGDEQTVRFFYNKETASYYYNRNVDPEPSDGSNHEVEIAGWDDSYPAENFSATCRPCRDGAWLIKNSWGENWGDNGYAWVSYEDTNFPMYAYCFDGLKPYDSSTIVHETDYKDLWYYEDWENEEEIYAAKTFTAAVEGEALQSLRINVASPCTKIEVDCIPDFSGDGSWEEYAFAAKGTKTLEVPCPGWYTVDLAQPVGLGAAGSKFTVIVKLTAAGKTISLGYDSDNSSGAPAYWSLDGKSWQEHKKDDGSYVNYCIKAVTKPAEEAVRDQVVAGKAADALAWELIRGGNTAQDQVLTDLTLPASFKYGTEVSWRSSDPAVAGSGGRVCRPVGDTPASVTLTATVRSGSAAVEVPFELVVVNVPPEVKQVLDGITWDAIRGSNTGTEAVASDLDLLTPGGQGVTVTWRSSDPDIIAEDGAVTQPRFDICNTVTLTVTAEKGAKSQDKTFTVTVPHRAQTEEDVAGAVNAWIGKDWYNHWWLEICGSNRSFNEIRTDLTIPPAITLVTGNGEDYTVEVADRAAPRSENESWAYISDTGAVTRPAYGQGDSKGVFHLVLKFGSGTKYAGNYIITVLAYKGTIKIDRQPESVKTESGQAAELTVQASQDEGSPGAIGAVAYQWYRAGDASGSGARPVEGATGATFRTDADLPDGRYYYFCEVSALDAAPVRTETARVTVGDVVTCTVTFDPGGGTLAGGAAAETDADGRLTALPVPTRGGYTFTGWYTAAAGGTKVTGDTVFADDAAVYAHWVSDSSPVSGACGDGTTWTYDSGALTILGKGMDDWVSSSEYGQPAPWHDRREQIETVSIGSGVTRIGSYAFFGCSNLRQVTIPGTVTGIGDGAFWDCSSLEFAQIPAGMTAIGFSTFRGCTGLKRVDLPGSLTAIGYASFYDCGSLKDVTIPAGVTRIDGWAFSRCGSLISLDIPGGVTSVAEYLFYGSSGLERVTIPGNVTAIGEQAFEGCSSLKDVTIPGNVTAIGERAFGGCSSLKDLSVPEGVTAIADFTFCGCSSLERVRIPGSVTAIGERAFENCSSLRRLSIPKGVTAIAAYTFYGCGSLGKVTIPGSVTGIGTWAFGHCSSLHSLSIPDSVTSVGYASFWGCGLDHVYYSGSKERWSQIDVNEFNAALTGTDIHYDAAPDGPDFDLTAQLDENGRVHYTVDSDASGTVLLAAALYEQSGKLRAEKTQPLALTGSGAGGELELPAKPAGSDYVKVFLLDRSGYTPLCPAARLAPSGNG